MYIEALSWMSYRYAIGITEYPKRNGLSDAERYRMFRDIEFNTEDFQAVAAAFTDFLKRKKITDIVTLRDKYRENDIDSDEKYQEYSRIDVYFFSPLVTRGAGSGLTDKNLSSRISTPGQGFMMVGKAATNASKYPSTNSPVSSNEHTSTKTTL